MGRQDYRQRAAPPSTIPAIMRSVILALACLLLAACSTPEAEQTASPPNIVVIVADDLGYNDLGSFGSEIIRTPHLDALAAGGVRATDGYVSAAVCSPSRAGLYTGRYQPRFGYEYNTSGRDTVVGLPTDERTLADMLGDAGYATGLIGKWHLGKSKQHHPLSRGFDEYFGVLAGGTSYIDSRRAGVQSWPASNAPTTRGDANAIFDGFEKVEVEEYLTDVFADRAVDFIRRHKDERFFLMLTPNSPHTPLQATTEYTDRYPDVEPEGRRIFAAMVSSIDDYVGDVVSELRANGLEENTLIVFTSDNGCVKYLSQDVCSNDPAAGIEAVPPRRRHSGAVHFLLARGPAVRANLRAADHLARSLLDVCSRGSIRGDGPGQREPPALPARRTGRFPARVLVLEVSSPTSRCAGASGRCGKSTRPT